MAIQETHLRGVDVLEIIRRPIGRRGRGHGHGCLALGLGADKATIGHYVRVHSDIRDADERTRTSGRDGTVDLLHEKSVEADGADSHLAHGEGRVAGRLDQDELAGKVLLLKAVVHGDVGIVDTCRCMCERVRWIAQVAAVLLTTKEYAQGLGETNVRFHVFCTTAGLSVGEVTKEVRTHL